MNKLIHSIKIKIQIDFNLNPTSNKLVLIHAEGNDPNRMRTHFLVAQLLSTIVISTDLSSKSHITNQKQRKKTLLETL